MLSPEERHERRKLAKAKYRASAKGKAAKKRDQERFRLNGGCAKADAKRDANLSPARRQARTNWAKRNKWYFTAERAHRRMLYRMPMSAAEKAEVDGMYMFCSIFPLFEVDHIIPVKGENVCGLHIPSNLQVLLRSENKRKGNRFTPPPEPIAVITCV